MMIVILILIFLLGICFGSFANVLVDRGEKGKSLWGFSKCDFCGYKLNWFDNIPILSFLAIGGKCRKCGRKLSWQYPIVELFMGLLFLLIAWKVVSLQIFGTKSLYRDLVPEDIVGLSFYLAVGFIFLAIFLWDLKYMIIPDGLVVGGLILSIGFCLYRYYLGGCSFLDPNCYILSSFIGAFIIGGFFYVLFVFSNGKWIGGGDVKLGFWLGFLVGWQKVYFLLLIAYSVGALVGVFLLIKGRKKMKSQIPFGPFLLIGAFIVMLWGEEILALWRNIIIN